MYNHKTVLNNDRMNGLNNDQINGFITDPSNYNLTKMTNKLYDQMAQMVTT